MRIAPTTFRAQATGKLPWRRKAYLREWNVHHQRSNEPPGPRAQAAGRAILTMDTNLGYVTMEAGRTGFLAKDFQEFQSHLLALAKDRSLSDELGRAAAAFVARSFSMEIRAAQIEKLLLGSEEDSNVRYRIPDPQTGVLPAREMLTKNLS